MQASQQLDSTGRFSSKLLKLGFCDLYQQHQVRNIYTVSAEVGEEGNNLSAVWRVAIGVNGNLRARTGTATTEENHFGSSCCFMAEY